VKTIEFPYEVSFKLIHGNEKETSELIAKKKFNSPAQLDIDVPKNPKFSYNKLILEACLSNNSKDDFLLIVMPTGGAAPYGGNNPFHVSFTEESYNSIKYVGEEYPPEPPLPMEILIPGLTTIKFTGEIDLRKYEYRGEPTIEINWLFHYYLEPFPKGSISITLPKR